MFDSLPNVDSEALEIPFSKEEVLATLSSLSGDKVIGLDGFSMAFWQFCWDFVKREVIGFFTKFYDLRSFQRSLNATFIVLVPKKRGGGGKPKRL